MTNPWVEAADFLERETHEAWSEGCEDWDAGFNNCRELCIAELRMKGKSEESSQELSPEAKLEQIEKLLATADEWVSMKQAVREIKRFFPERKKV